MNDLPDDLIQTRWSLIQRLKNLEDNDSWQAFFDLYWRLILNAAGKAGLNHSEAEEVLQQTIIELSRKIGGFRADPAAGSFGGWLMKLTHWRIADQFRKRARAEALRHHKRARQDSGDEPTTATEERVADPAGNLLEAVWAEEWRESVLDAALEKLKTQLKPKHYQIFYLAVVKEMPVAKVARTLAVNAGQVYLVKHRVGKDFKQALKEAQAKLEMGSGTGQSAARSA
jgi:RNA polymerase sigma factor (sigma-70 family)